MDFYSEFVRKKLRFDGDKLLSEVHLIRNYYQFEKLVGYFIQLLGIAVVLWLLFSSALEQDFILQRLVDPGSLSASELLFTAAISLLCYSLYLVRDKDRFQSDLKNHDFAKFKEIRPEQLVKLGELEWVDYAKGDVLVAIASAVIGKSMGTYDFALLVAGLLNSVDARKYLDTLGIEAEKLQTTVLSWQKGMGQAIVNVQPKLEKVAADSAELSLNLYLPQVTSGIFLLSLLRNSPKDLQLQLKLDAEDFAIIFGYIKAQNKDLKSLEQYKKRSIFGISSLPNTYTGVYAKTIEKYSTDLTRLAENEIGRKGLLNFRNTLREKEYAELVNELASDKGLVSVVGKSGVGKSILINNLVLDALTGSLNRTLLGKRIIELNINALLADEEKLIENLNAIFEEQERSANFILFIDNFDQLLDLSDGKRQEVIGLLFSKLQKVQIRMVITLGSDAFQRKFMSEEGLSSLFSVINLVEMDFVTSCIAVLSDYEAMGFNVPLAKQIVNLAPMYSVQKSLPDSALVLAADLQARAGVDKRALDPGFVVELVSEKTGANALLPGTRKYKETLLGLENDLGSLIIGQSEAVQVVADTVRRGAAGFSGSNRPLASMMFYGPTGVGKTETAKILARLVFGNDNLFLRLDMSEFQEENNIARLLGQLSQNGEWQPGLLTSFVAKHPYCVVLFDEIEKANPKVLDLLLQVLDAARLTDGAGETVAFGNTLIIATTNSATAAINSYIAQNNQTDYRSLQAFALESLKNQYRLEFLNRFSSLVLFKPLAKHSVEKIARMFLEEQKILLAERGFKFNYDENLVKEIVENNYNHEFGAREIRRAVENIVQSEAAKEVLR